MRALQTVYLLTLLVSLAWAKSTAKTAKDELQQTKANSTAEEEPAAEGEEVLQYPYRDLPADVLRDFPGMCFGSTALRLFHVGQSWSLTPFCGVATCLYHPEARQLIERVQDCGPQPKKNPKCKNVNAKSEAQFPYCCPRFECEEGVELEYPTQEELQQLAHEAAQAAVRAQYDQADEEDTALTGRVAAPKEEASDDVAAAEEVEEEVPAKKSDAKEATS